MSVNNDFDVLTQLQNQAALTVLGFDIAGVATLYGIFAGSDPGLVPEASPGDAFRHLVGSGDWVDIVTDASEYEIPRYAAFALEGGRLFNPADGQLDLGDNGGARGSLIWRSGSSTLRKANKQFVFDDVGTTVTEIPTILSNIPNNTVLIIKLMAGGITEVTSPGAEAFGAEIGAVFRVDNAGVMTQIGSTENVIALQENQATGAPTVEFGISGNDLQLKITNPGTPVGNYRMAGMIDLLMITKS